MTMRLGEGTGNGPIVEGLRGSISDGDVARVPLQEVSLSGNTFVEFLTTNQQLVTDFSIGVRDLKRMQEQWRGSSQFDDMAKEGYAIFLANAPAGIIGAYLGQRGIKRISPTIKGAMGKVEGTLKRKIEELILDTPLDQHQESFHRVGLSAGSEARLSFAMKARYSAWKEKILTLGFQFHTERKTSLVTSKARRQELYNSLQAYLEADISHIEDFARFLTDSDFAVPRQDVYTFLAEFAQDEHTVTMSRRPSVLGEAVGVLTEKLRGTIDKDLLLSLIGKEVTQTDLKTGVSKPRYGLVGIRTDSEYGQLVIFAMAFAANMSTEVRDKVEAGVSITPEQFLAYIPTMDAWPQRAQEEYRRAAVGKIGEIASCARLALAQFRKIEKGQGVEDHIIFEEEAVDEKALPVSEASAVVKSGDVVKRTYSVGLLESIPGKSKRIRPINSGELDRYLGKRAKRIGGNDKRLLVDLKTIIASLRQNPFGYGVEKMDSGSISLNNQDEALMRFSPRERPDITLAYPDISNIRIVYVAQSKADTHYVVLEGVYTHNEFIARFNQHIDSA